MSLHSICANSIGRIVYRWEEVERDYGESAATLETEFGKYPECPSAYVLNFGRQFEKLRCVYQGVVAGRMLGFYSNVYSRAGILFLENEWRPETAINRSDITRVPLIVLVLIEGILNKYQMHDYTFDLTGRLYNMNYSLKEWREIWIPELNKWMNINLKTFLAERMNF